MAVPPQGPAIADTVITPRTGTIAACGGRAFAPPVGAPYPSPQPRPSPASSPWAAVAPAPGSAASFSQQPPRFVPWAPLTYRRAREIARRRASLRVV
jgi:hypothetical protein